MSDTVLVVAAHPDDEVLGCGGTIARHVAAGDTVHVLFLADGVNARNGTANEMLNRRQAAARAAAAALGVADVVLGTLPDNRLDTVAMLDIVRLIEAELAEVAPSVIYTHHGGDLNVDHQRAHQAVLTACRPQPTMPVRRILAFEVLSSTEWAGPDATPFRPSVFVDISDYLDQKLAALTIYADEMRSAPHARSIDNAAALARHRGATVGHAAAEAFVLVREVR
jgi:LmbE family N-acetylglucosaminyl deacetylase